MRLSRPCYDKPHRCPGWAGGGWKSTGSDDDRCEGGYVTTKTPDRVSPLEYGGERTCTCGEAIRPTMPENGWNTPWVDGGGSTWCPQTRAGWLTGHRPPFEYAHPGADKWRPGHCAGRRAENQDRKPGEGCGVVTVPWALRKLDPTWWWGYYGWRVRAWLTSR